MDSARSLVGYTEPGGLQSMGSQKRLHNLETKQQLASSLLFHRYFDVKISYVTNFPSMTFLYAMSIASLYLSSKALLAISMT